MTTPTHPRIRVAVLMGGPSHEHDISLASGQSVCDLLSQENCDVTPVVILQDGHFQVDGGAIASPCDALSRLLESGIEVAFLALHGEACEDGAIQGFLEWAGLPYTFSGVEASVLAMNKCAFKALLLQEDIATPAFSIIDQTQWNDDREGVIDSGIASVGLPAFLKASGLGSSYGVHRVTDRSEVEASLNEIMRISRQALWERAVDGVELTASVVGDGTSGGAPEALQLVEIHMEDGELFDTENKYNGKAEEIVPARVSESVRDELQATAIRIHSLLGCRSLSRTDAILTDGGRLVVLETNTIPGLTTESLFPRAAGSRLGKLLRGMVDSALQHPTVFRKRGAD